MAGIFAGLVAGAGVTQGIQLLADFSQQLSTIQAVTGATGAEFEQLSQRAQELGTTTRFSASQAAEAMVLLARAGFETDEVFESVQDTLQLAQAGGLGLAEAANIAAGSLRGFQLEAGEIGRVVDVLAAGANSANTSVSQLGQALTFVAPVAAGLNTNIEETTAAILALSDAGIQSTRAGTGLRVVFSQLEQPVGAAVEVLEQLGLSQDDVRISSVGLTTALERLGAAGITTGQTLRLFGQEAGPAAAVLINNIPGVREFTEELENAGGTANRVATIMDDNLNGALLSVRSAFEGLIISIGEAGATGALTSLLRSLASGIRVLAANADVLINTAQALATVFGVRLAGQVLPLVIARFRALTAAIVANPFGALTTGVTAAIAVLVAFQDEIRVSSDSFATLGDVFAVTIERVQDLFAGLSQALGTVFQPLTTGGQEAAEETEISFRFITITIANAADAILGTILGLGGGIGNAFLAIPDAVGEGLVLALNTVLALIERVIDSVRASIGGLVNTVARVVLGLADSFAQLGQAINDALSGNFEAAAESVAAAGNLISGQVAGAFGGLPDEIQREFSRLQAEDLIPPVDNPFEGAGSRAANAFSAGFEEGFDLVDFTGAVEGIFDEAERRAVERETGAGRERLTSLFENVTGLVSRLFDTAGEAAGSALTRVENFISALQTTATEEVAARPGIASILEELDQEATLLGLTNREREVQNELLRIEQQLREDGVEITDQERQLLETRLQGIQALNDQAQVLQQIRGPQEDLEARQAALNALFEQGRISASEYNTAINEIALASARAGTSIEDGLTAGLLAAQQRFQDVSGLAEQTVTRAFSGLEDAFVSLATTGSANFSQLIDSIIADLARLLARQAIGGLFGLLGGGGGGGGGLGGLLGGLFGRQFGGAVQPNRAFVVGEQGPEIFVPPAAGQIVPAPETAAILGGGGQAAAAPVVVEAPPVNINNVVVDDPDAIPQGIESPDGQQAVMNVIQRRRPQVRGILGT